VAAIDPPALPVAGPFHGLPQVPALVEWRLVDGGASTPWQVTADFRTSEPPPSDFWQVYAPGTYQNSPVFARHNFLRTPGRYLFRLDLNPSQQRPGQYQLEVRVADIRDNHSTASWSLRVASR
jgi:hypothetical protein